jgi:hypothetical protein
MWMAKKMLSFGKHWMEEFAEKNDDPPKQTHISTVHLYFTNLQSVNEHKPLSPLLLRFNGINRRNVDVRDSSLSLDLSIHVWKGTSICSICSFKWQYAFKYKLYSCKNWISRTCFLHKSYWEVFPDLSGSTSASPKGVWSRSTSLTLNRITE